LACHTGLALNPHGMVLQIALIYAGGYWDGTASKHQHQLAIGIGVYMQVIPASLRSN